MATKQSIVNAIVERVNNTKNPNFTSWQIGLTHNPSERKTEHENNDKTITYWKQWIADSLSDAEEIESYFINNKKMKGGTGGDLSHNKTVYVYIF